MPQLSAPTTAEHVLGSVEAVIANGGTATTAMVADFLDVTNSQATAALVLATELGLLALKGQSYIVDSPLCGFVAVRNQMQKAAILRVLLESYTPFITFRERLLATADVGIAAKQTKSVCQLGAHRDEIRDTLVSLGTYSQAFTPTGGGNYELETGAAENPLFTLAQACTDRLAAESRIRAQLGPTAEAVVSRDEVLLPLRDALLDARAKEADAAVQKAGNAVESYLVELAGRMNVNVTGANGINAKLERFYQNPRKLPKKLVRVGNYLGEIRNAADHGVDAEVGSSWRIREETGLEYVFVACSFIAACVAVEQEEPAEI